MFQCGHHENFARLAFDLVLEPPAFWPADARDAFLTLGVLLPRLATAAAFFDLAFSPSPPAAASHAVETSMSCAAHVRHSYSPSSSSRNTCLMRSSLAAIQLCAGAAYWKSAQ